MTTSAFAASETDGLTGLFTRRGIAGQVNALLQGSSGGVLLALDIDGLSGVNRTLGHLTGDRLICEVARIIKEDFFPREPAGRTGGDVFVVYLSQSCSRRCIDERGEQLRRYLQGAGRQIGGLFSLSVTMGCAFRRAGDDFDTLYTRALQEIASIRVSRARYAGAPRLLAERSARRSGVCTDIELIRQDLREPTLSPGAYCQDYAIFQRIYRFVERSLARSGSSAYIILMTLTDEAGNFIPLEVREEAMDRLQHIIRYSLRSGDVFTCYSSCQYLLLVLGTTAQNAMDIGQRIQGAFLQETGSHSVIQLSYDIHALQPFGQKGAPT